MTVIAGSKAPKKPENEATNKSLNALNHNNATKQRVKAYRQNRIVGGSDVEKYSMPWQVVVVERDEMYHYCGGTILCPKFVLSAAHCTHEEKATDPKQTDKKPSEYDVLAGIHDLSIKVEDEKEGIATRHHIKAFHNHPDYKKAKDYDISIFELGKPIDLDAEHDSVWLADKNFKISPGAWLVVSGWGYSEFGKGYGEDTPDAVKVPAVTNSKCKEAYGETFKAERMLCAGFMREGGKDACSGDSGGPLTLLDPKTDHIVLVGVVSFGYECARAGKPGVYARVNSFYDWIKGIIGSCNDDTCKKEFCMTGKHLNDKTMDEFYDEVNINATNYKQSKCPLCDRKVI